jgi:predicted PilT family ATPase
MRLLIKINILFYSGDTSVISLEDDISPERVGAVIGTKGQCISEIMKRSGCKITINQKFPEGEQHRIAFSGTFIMSEVIKYSIASFSPLHY